MSVPVTDDFGDVTTVPELVDPGVARCSASPAPRGGLLPGVVLPPVAAGPLVGDAVEEVPFLRDEMANMAWAIERTVPGRSGDPRPRAAEPQPAPDPWPADLVPTTGVRAADARAGRTGSRSCRSPAGRTVGLRKGAMLADDEPVLAAGVRSSRRR